MPKNGQQQERKDHRVRGGEGEKGTGGEGRKEPPRARGAKYLGAGARGRDGVKAGDTGECAEGRGKVNPSKSLTFTLFRSRD
jgi:hypothetical protein